MHRVLIVGGGSIGERHLRCFLKTGRAEVSVCDNRPERLKQLAAQYPVKATYEDFDAADLSRFTAGVVCVPANLHIPWSQKMVDAGLHVLCEKPLALDMGGMDALERSVQKRGTTFGVAYVRRAMQASRVTKEALDSGHIGEVLSLCAVTGYDHRVARPDYRNTYAVRRDMGGGAIYDIASHAVNAIQWYLGLRVKSVTAQYDHLQVEDTDVEDTLAILLRFQNSRAMANLNIVMWQAHRWDQTTFAGTKGSVLCDGWEGRVGTIIRGSDHWSWVEGLKSKPDAKGQVDEPFVAEDVNFLDAVEGKTRVLCTLAEARHTLEVQLAAFESGERRREITIPLKEDVMGA